MLALAISAAHSEQSQVQEIVEATRLFESGRLDEAQAIVSRLRAQPDADLQVLFLSGALHFTAGRYLEAAEEFRLMLARDPSLIRPRLELARALFMAREYNAARYHFEQTLAFPLPEGVKANVLGFLKLIQEHLPSFALSVDIVSDSNPKQATSSKVVEIGGAPFQLSESARAKEALGVLIVAQAKVPLPDHTSWFARGYLEHSDYAGGDLDLSYSQLLGGKHVDFGAHGLDFEAGGHLANYGGNTLYRGPVWRVSDFIRIRPTFGVTLSADAKQLRYPDFTFLTGWQRTGSADFRYALDPQTSLSAGLSYVRNSAQERPYAFDGAAANLRYVREWKRGWISSLAYQYGRYQFDDVDPFFGVVRSDQEQRAEVGIVNRYLSYRRFSPRLTVGATERRSSIDLFSYKRRYVRVGVVTEF